MKTLSALFICLCMMLGLTGQAQAAPLIRVVDGQNVIAVVGNLHSSWNLPAVLKDWSASPYIELVRRPSCAGYARCITIKPETRFPDRWGQAYLGWSADRSTQRAFVWVSPDVPGVYLRKAAVCHEIGHTLTNATHPNLGCMSVNLSGDRRWPGTRNLYRAR